MANKFTVGWREWVALPELGVRRIKAKIDTGARSSALHAEVIETYTKDGKQWLMFQLVADKKDGGSVIECHAPLKDRRVVSDSGGHKQRRYVIETVLLMGSHHILAEITLTNRDAMRFPMLIGRTALSKHILVDPSVSYLQKYPNTDS